MTLFVTLFVTFLLLMRFVLLVMRSLFQPGAWLAYGGHHARLDHLSRVILDIGGGDQDDKGGQGHDQ